MKINILYVRIRIRIQPNPIQPHLMLIGLKSFYLSMYNWSTDFNNSNHIYKSYLKYFEQIEMQWKK